MKLTRTIFMFFALALTTLGVFAQSTLTNGQKNTLRTAIAAEPALATALSIRDDAAISVYCNAKASPVQKAWRQTYSAAELFGATVLTEYIARSAAERQGYDLLIQMGAINPARNRIRAAIADIFSGASNSTSRGLVLNNMTEDATWCEVKLGGTDATTSTVTAWERNWAGRLGPSDISTLLNTGQ